MAYIVPDSDVKLLTGIHLDKGYQNTAYFTSITDQYNFFNTHTAHTLSSMYYQRRDRDYIRIGIPYAQCYDVNYMMFRNTQFENKWWYAFVDSVTYINDNVTELHYTIDVIQSWVTAIILEDCYVERQHSTTDAIGDNIVAETFNPQEYIFNDMKRLEYADPIYSTQLAIIVAVADIDSAPVQGSSQGGVYSGATLTAFAAEDISGIDAFMSTYKARPDAIVGLYSTPLSSIPAPRPGWDSQTSSYTHVQIGQTSYNFHTWTGTALTGSETLDGYTPKNKKMYTYPYNLLTVSNPKGESNVYRYEFFTSLTPAFLVYDT